MAPDSAQYSRDHRDVAAAIKACIRDQSGVVANAMMATTEETEEAEAAE